MVVVTVVLDEGSFCVRCCTNTGFSSEEELGFKIYTVKQRQKNLHVIGEKQFLPAVRE